MTTSIFNRYLLCEPFWKGLAQLVRGLLTQEVAVRAVHGHHGLARGRGGSAVSLAAGSQLNRSPASFNNRTAQLLLRVSELERGADCKFCCRSPNFGNSLKCWCHLLGQCKAMPWASLAQHAEQGPDAQCLKLWQTAPDLKRGDFASSPSHMCLSTYGELLLLQTGRTGVARFGFLFQC